jgi:hypothetical protein
VGLSCSNIVIKTALFKEAGGSRVDWPKAFPADQHDTVLRFGTCGPCVIITKPATVGYQQHASNVVHDTARMIDNGILTLVKSERQGHYPGGVKRRFRRYSIIGGDAMCWVRRAIKQYQLFLGLRLLVLTFPMIAAGAVNLLLRKFRRCRSSSSINCQLQEYFLLQGILQMNCDIPFYEYFASAFGCCMPVLGC